MIHITFLCSGWIDIAIATTRQMASYSSSRDAIAHRIVNYGVTLFCSCWIDITVATMRQMASYISS